MDGESPAAAEAGTLAPPAPQWVIFSCGGKCLGLALERVQEILTPRPFTRLPGARADAAGLIGVRSRIVTAYDLGALLGGTASAAGPNHRILLVEDGERVSGLIVDEVLAVAGLEIDDNQATYAPELALGTGAWDERAVTLLDVERVLERVTN